MPPKTDSSSTSTPADSRAARARRREQGRLRKEEEAPGGSITIRLLQATRMTQLNSVEIKTMLDRSIEGAKAFDRAASGMSLKIPLLDISRKLRHALLTAVLQSGTSCAAESRV
ncbi:hypothetical protein I309_05887 [Cryptococcus deuterogattii LA55]|nr:hypothetical protein I309_05887 [Cryptococcus deuterogattii LA55]KIR33953.1 hypothetical protein I352_03182 [Cryptococcus deuterogattii MMRL2647]KIR91487.1 hypothetical protein I304_04962 [Cryptococcus deuterogattii CBS 10090]